MSFETFERIAAVAPAAVDEILGALVEQYGEVVADGTDRIRTIGAFWDDSAHTRIRAASLNDGTITGIPLSDGRVTYRCLWQSDLADAFSSGGIQGITELTEQEFEDLRLKV